jgi:hypothetical protein
VDVIAVSFIVAALIPPKADPICKGVFDWIDEVRWDGVISVFIVLSRFLVLGMSVKKSGISPSLKKSRMSSSHFIKHID